MLGPTVKVALSTADTNKWATLLKKRDWTPKLESTNPDYERIGPILRRQRRLTAAQAVILANRYEDRASVYQLAKEFGICRSNVSQRLKKAGVTATSGGCPIQPGCNEPKWDG